MLKAFIFYWNGVWDVQCKKKLFSPLRLTGHQVQGHMTSWRHAKWSNTFGNRNRRRVIFEKSAYALDTVQWTCVKIVKMYLFFAKDCNGNPARLLPLPRHEKWHHKSKCVTEGVSVGSRNHVGSRTRTCDCTQPRSGEITTDNYCPPDGCTISAVNWSFK